MLRATTCTGGGRRSTGGFIRLSRHWRSAGLPAPAPGCRRWPDQDRRSVRRARSTLALPAPRGGKSDPAHQWLGPQTGIFAGHRRNGPRIVKSRYTRGDAGGLVDRRQLHLLHRLKHRPTPYPIMPISIISTSEDPMAPGSSRDQTASALGINVAFRIGIRVLGNFCSPPLAAERLVAADNPCRVTNSPS